MNSAIAPRRFTQRPGWRWLMRALTLTFFGVVVWLLYKHARNIDWRDVWRALREHPPLSLALGALLAASSHLLYSCFDLLGRAHTGHQLSRPLVMLTTFVSYAFNLNFGSLIGGVAFRYRLYARLGLPTATTSQVLGVSMLTNWLGYTALAGALFLLHPFEVPEEWAIGVVALRVLGGALLCVAAGYVALCAFSSRRHVQIRGHDLRLPTLRFALLQLGLSVLNWCLIGGAIYMLLQQRIAYPTALAVFLVAAVAGVIAHVPAGLGVLEAVFVALLAESMPVGELLAGLLAYRGMYYLVPLLVAAVLYVLIEAGTRTRNRPLPEEERGTRMP